MKSIRFYALLLPLLLLITPVWADTTLAVTDFELLDLTMKLSDPQKVAEIEAQDQKKLDMINTMLRAGIAQSEGFTVIPISAEARTEADKSTGYLFDCAECSAALGHAHNADYILIGRLHKPTYLFSYMIVRIFDSTTNKLVKEFRSEVKGVPEQAIPGAVYNLINKINKTLPH